MNKKILSLHIFAVLFSGVCLFAAFPPIDEPIAVFFALAPLLIISRINKPLVSAKWTFLAGAVFWGASLSWMPAISKNGGPLPLVLLAWFILATYCALFTGVFGFLNAKLWSKISCRPSFARVAAATIGEGLLWAFLEWLRGWLLGGFAWNFLGVAAFAVKHSESPSIFSSAASVGGVYLISIIVVAVNGVAATSLIRIFAPLFNGGERMLLSTKEKFLRTAETALPLLLVLSAIIFKTLPPCGFPVKFLVVQPNSPCFFNNSIERENPFLVMERLTRNLSEKAPDILLLPESAFSQYGISLDNKAAPLVAKKLMELANAKALLAGGDSSEIMSDSSKRCYNSAGLFTYSKNNPDKAQIYNKQHLVPFGEFIPLDKIIKPLQKFSPIGVSLYPGKPQLLEYKLASENQTIKVAPFICYEDTDSSLMRTAAKNGAQILALITNDSWFSGSAETLQHFRQSILRSAETGLPLIRCGNSGVSGVVNPNGTYRFIKAPESLDTEPEPVIDRQGSDIFYVIAQTSKNLTIYTKFGDVPLVVASLFLVALTVVPFRKKSWEK